VQGVPLADYVAMLDERATFMGRWGLRAARGGDGASYDELAATEGRPRLAAWLERIRTEQMLDPSIVYGYFPAWSEGDDIVIAHHGAGSDWLGSGGIGSPDGGSAVLIGAAIPAGSAVLSGAAVPASGASGGEPGTERLRFHFPRQHRDRHLCLADFIRPRSFVEETGRFDVLPVQLVTMGTRVSEATAKLFAADEYRAYLELHGLTVQLTEALAEFWHARVRAELGFATSEPTSVEGIFKLDYRGGRFSLGYPACPDMEDRHKIVELLRPDRVGVTLSEELQLHPEQSTDAFVFHHPEAKYFSV
jgi:5-methyltetrahydrofolate--homocysteine methyltransferase